MSQGDLCRLVHGGELVCHIQADLGAETPMVLCAPVIPRDLIEALIPRLHIEFGFDGGKFVILMSEMTAIPRKDLSEPLGEIRHLRDDIVGAVGLLVVGF